MTAHKLNSRQVAQIRGQAVVTASSSRSVWTSDAAVLIYIALATVVLHVLTGNRYGFQRDELATLEDARHLAWGFVAYPPVTPFFARISLALFGTSLVGFRVFAFIAQAAAVVLTGLMARQLGGRRGAQLVAAVASVPFCLGGGALMQYVSFDYLSWVLVAYFAVRLLASGNPRWWMAIGAAIGFGMMSKYSMPFFVAGLAAGVFLTDARRYLRTKWMWYGAGIALLIFLPNLIWQVRHDFVSIDFLRHIHARAVSIGRTQNFLPQQLEMTLFAIPLWVAGLYFYFRSRDGRKFRVLGWMYVVPLLLFMIAKGRGYYLAGAYPMLYAAGSVWGERWLASLSFRLAKAVRVVAWAALAANIVVIGALFLPIAPVNSRWFKAALKVNGDFAEELGWPELVETVAKVRDSLPPQERQFTGILAANYGEAGAVNLWGPRYGLPRAISGINSFWQRGYGDPPPQTLIVLGLSREFVDRTFVSCEVVAHTWNRYGVMNEETRNHSDIFVCRGLRRPWPEFWMDFRYYG
jgi:4-amino-4-deoxy-L-arabinose transferase-like glycosyltransferase